MHSLGKSFFFPLASIVFGIAEKAPPACLETPACGFGNAKKHPDFFRPGMSGVCSCPVSIQLVVLPHLKSGITGMPVSLRHAPTVIVVEVIGVVPLSRRGREHKLDIVPVVLHDTVVIPSNVTTITNPFLQSREIIRGIEICHSSDIYYPTLSVLSFHLSPLLTLKNIQRH